MLHSLVCCNEDGFVLLARYFDPGTTLDARKEYEAQLARVCGQVPHLWGGADKGKADREPPDQLALCRGNFVVMRQVGELLLLLSGDTEYDELMRTCRLLLPFGVKPRLEH